MAELDLGVEIPGGLWDYGAGSQQYGNIKLGKPRLESRIKDDYHYALEKQSPWRKIARKCFRFYGGNQWEPRLRSYLKSAGQPVLTMNHILGVVNLVIGHYWINQFDSKVFPREGGDDKVAEILTDILRYIDDDVFGKLEIGDAFRDALICGQGFLDLGIDRQTDLLGDVTYRRFNPLRVLYDPDAEQRLWKDCHFIIKELDYNKEDLINDFPDSEDLVEDIALWMKLDAGSKSSGLGGSMDYSITHDSKPGGSYNDPSAMVGLLPDRRPFKVLEYQYKKYETVISIVNIYDGEIIGLSKEEYAANKDTFGDETVVIKQRVPKVQRASLLLGADELLEGPIPNPVSTEFYSIVPVFGYDALGKKFGIVENLIDPQESENKGRSQLQHIINTSPGVGLTVDRGALDKKTLANLENQGLRHGAILEVRPGSRVVERQGQRLPEAAYRMVLDSKENIYDISTVNRDLMGFKEDKTASGRAISLRQRQGAVSLQGFLEELKYARRLLSKIEIELVQDNYDYDKIERIIGETLTRRYGATEIERIINAVGLGRYDVIVAEGESTPSARLARFEEGMRMWEAGFKDIQEIRSNLLKAITEASDLDAVAKEGMVQRLEVMTDMAAQGMPGPGGPMPPMQPMLPIGMPMGAMMAGQAA
jgi:hypothetical protein